MWGYIVAFIVGAWVGAAAMIFMRICHDDDDK